MPATAAEFRARRRMAERIDRDRAALERKAYRAIRVIGRRISTAAIGAIIDGRDPREPVSDALTGLVSLLRDAAVAAHLAGRWRAYVAAVPHLRARRGLGAYDDATRAMYQRLNVSPDELDEIARQYGNEAARVTRKTSQALERAAQRAARDIVQEGMHVTEGIARMRTALDASGLTAGKPWLAETLVRTQIQIAYSAGQYNANQDPAIDSILWGYEYSTVGDDRVRPEHAALEGARYAKDDPMLSAVWPPNGFNCRCVLIEIFNDDPQEWRTPSSGTDIRDDDGNRIVGKADAGFDFNPGAVYRDGISPQVEKRPPTPVSPKRKPRPTRVLPHVPATEAETQIAGGLPAKTIGVGPGDKSFDSWFYGSEIKDSSGNPQPVYHGTDAIFDRFAETKIGSATDAGFLGRGFYFSTDPAVANTKTYEVQAFLKASRTMEIEYPTWRTNKETLIRDRLGLSGDATAADVTAALRSAGYDGVRLDYSPVGYKHKEIAVFDPEQIWIYARRKIK